MIAGIILLLHLVAAVVAYRRSRHEGISEGLLGVGFFVIIFAVGWTIATMATNLIFTPDWFVRWYYQPLESDFWVLVRKELNRDTISLLLLTAGEAVFYSLYLQGEKKPKGKSSDSASAKPEEK